MIYIFIAFCIAFAFELFIIPKLLVISFKKKLFDVPNDRKMHTGAISRLGGSTFFPVIIFTFFIIIALILLIEQDIDYLRINGLSLTQIFVGFAILFCSLILLYLLGLMDDLIGARYLLKLSVQVFCGILLVVSGTYVNSFYGLFGIGELPLWIAYPLTVFLVVFILNGFNFIDGIDGLAAGISIIAFLVLGILFYIKGFFLYSLFSVISLGCMTPFFFYNVFGIGKCRKRKIFMGDTGSLTLGMLLAFLTIRYSMEIPYISLESYINPNPLLIYSVLIVPCFDVVRVAFHRVRKGCNPFKPDKNHLHHKIIRMGMTPRKTLLIVLFMAAFFIMLNYGLDNYISLEWIVIIDVFACAFMHFWINFKLKAVSTKEFLV